MNYQFKLKRFFQKVTKSRTTTGPQLNRIIVTTIASLIVIWMEQADGLIIIVMMIYRSSVNPVGFSFDKILTNGILMITNLYHMLEQWIRLVKFVFNVNTLPIITLHWQNVNRTLKSSHIWGSLDEYFGEIYAKRTTLLRLISCQLLPQTLT